MTPNSTQGFSWKTAGIVCIAVGVLALGLTIGLQSKIVSVINFEPQAVQQQLASNGGGGTGSSYTDPGAPKRLIIPAIGVDANIQSVGRWWRDPSEMGIPTNFTDVAWYNEGPKPGVPGSAVIDGHLDGKEVKEAVFYHLADLKQGDKVQVEDSDGKMLTFKVVATKLYDYNASTTDIFTDDPGKIRLNLITCAGDWITSSNGATYNQRVVVFTELDTSSS